ncbi:MAG: Fic family protein [Fimbriimonadaceae bacterium]
MNEPEMQPALALNPFDPKQPFNSLPPIPTLADLETPAALKRSTKAQVALAELREAGNRLPDQTFLVRALQIQEAKQSSEIENIVTTNDALYAALDDTRAVADPATREVLHHSDAIWCGYEQLRQGRPISPSMIVKVASVITQTDTGVRTMPGTVIANSATGQVVYTPPVGKERILHLLGRLCDFLDQEEGADPIIKMAAGHYQFEAIHPFHDGNGRTGRVLNMLYLMQAGLIHVPTLYLSRPILASKPDYYRLLRGVTEQGDWAAWVEYMVEVTAVAAEDALRRIRTILQVMESVEQRAREGMRRGFSKELIELVFRLPYTRIQNVEHAGIAKRDTASAYLRELERLGILVSTKRGRDVLFLNEPYLRALID